MSGPPIIAAMLSLAVVVTGSSCTGRRDGLSRDALHASLDGSDAHDRLPSIADLLAMRVPQLPPAQSLAAPSPLLGTASQQAFARGDDIPADDETNEGMLLRCLRADALRNYIDIAGYCPSFVTAAPGDMRAAVVMGILGRHLGSFNDDTRRGLVATTAPALENCRSTRGAGSCALMALTAHQLRVGVARALGDHPSTIEKDPILLQHAEVDGPWLNADEQFADSQRSAAPLRKHPRHRAWSIVAAAGRLRPAADVVEGWYRVSIRADAAREGPATMFVHADDAVEIRVDDVPVFVRHAGDSSATWAWIPVFLNRGGHLVELLTLDRGHGVSVAVIDDDGSPALSTSAKKHWARPAGVRLRAEDRGLKSMLLPATLLTTDTAMLPTLLLRHHAGMLGLGETNDDLQNTTRRLMEAFAWSPPAAVSAALGIEQDRLPDRTLRGLAAPVWASVEASWPNAPLPLLARARAANDDAPEQALAAYRALVGRSPNYPVGLREFIGVLLERHLVDEALVVADRLLALGETTENIDAALPALRAAGATTRVAHLLDMRAARGPALWGWQRHLQQGDTAGALRDLVNHDAETDAGGDQLSDDDAGNDDDKVDVTTSAPVLDFLEIHRPAQAKASVTRALRRHPHDVELAVRAIRLSGDVHLAEALVARTATLRGVLLAESMGVSPPWAAALQEGDAVIEARHRAQPSFPTASLVALHFNSERHFAADGSALLLRHWIFEARSKDALDALGELRRGDGEALVRLRVVKPDGRILEPEHHAEVEDISLTGLGPGDLVEWLSVAEDDAARDGTFWESVSLQGTTPFVLRRHVVTWPTALEASRTIIPIAENGAAPGVQAPAGDRITLTFVAHDVAALKNEPHSVAAIDDEPQVGVIVDADPDLYRRMRAAPWRPHSIDPWLHVAANAIAGHGDRALRLGRLFRFVTTRIVEASSPADPTSTLATGRGRRLPLLWTLLRANDIPVRPLAVHTDLEPSLKVPSESGFSIVVLAIELEGRRSIAASFDDGLLLDRLPQSLRGAQTIDLENGVVGTLSDEAIDPSGFEIQLDLSLGDDASLTGVVAVRLPAAFAGALRPTVLAATPSQLANFIETICAASFPGASASNITTPGLDSAGGPLAFLADLRIPVDAGGQIRFEHLFAEGAASSLRMAPPLQSYTQVAERHRTLLVAPWQEHIEVVLRLPSTASVVELPPAMNLEAGPLRLVQRSVVDHGVVVWDRTIAADSARVRPEDWQRLRSALVPLMAAADARLSVAMATASAVH
jgi:hypothetical protein